MTSCNCAPKEFIVKYIYRLAPAILLCLSACAGSIRGLPVSQGVKEVGREDPDYTEKIQIKYLASGGLLIRRGEQAILTGPFFSNPTLKRLLLLSIRPNPEQIDRFMIPIRDAVEDVEAVVVGHAHYDHLMDLPYIVRNYLPKATVYGSRTATSILAAELRADQLVTVNDNAGTPAQPGNWYWTAADRIRFMAIESEHAPHLWGKKFFTGKYSADLNELPTRASSWREGQTFSFLIDFMNEDGKKVDFRIHYQDAASNPPLGFPPSFAFQLDETPVDLAIVCVAGYQQVEQYPESIIRELNPRFVVLGHWENFFGHLPDEAEYPQTVPMTNAKKFIARLKTVFPHDDRIEMPLPGAWMTFDPM